LTQTTKRSTAIVKRAEEAADVAASLTIEQLIDQARTIQEAMKAVMRDGEHYGVIPGTDKPTLLKPGAEKLCLLFRLDPQYEIIESSENDRIVSYTVRAVIFHSPTGTRLASGMGQADSREAKYRYRYVASEDRPDKKTADELKAKGLGRWRKQGGQWTWFTRIDNDNPMDQANTLLKMACKRALIAGILNATAASDIFTQDLEDLGGQTLTTAESETLLVLRALAEQAAAINPELWTEDVVLRNATARFGRPVANYDQLQETEAQLIITGARAWLEAHSQAPRADEPAPVEESETVSADEMEVVGSDGPAGESDEAATA
jgi:hypothetical protein